MNEDASPEQSPGRTDDGSSPPALESAVEDVAGMPEVMVGPGAERPVAGYEAEPAVEGADPETSGGPPAPVHVEASDGAVGPESETHPEGAVVELPRSADPVGAETGSAVDLAGGGVRSGSDGPYPAAADDPDEVPGPGWVVVADYDVAPLTTEDPSAARPTGEAEALATDDADGVPDGTDDPPVERTDDGPAVDPSAADVAGAADDLSLDAIALALGGEPPVPVELRREEPAGSVAHTEPVAAASDGPPAGTSAEGGDAASPAAQDAPEADEWPAASADPVEWAADPDGVAAADEAARREADGAVAADEAARADADEAARLEAEEVADFWYPPEIVDEASAPGPETPEETPQLREPSGASRWSAEEEDDVLGLRGLAADWKRDDGPTPPDAPGDDPSLDDTWVEGGWVDGGWVDDERPPRTWRRPVAALAGRWSTMRTGERVNVVLYALTGVSIVAMGLELLAGPDSIPTEVSTTPTPVVSTTTVRQSTTITFTIPKAPAAAAPETGPATAPERPAPVTPTAPRATTAAPDPTVAPEPPPEPDPTTPPAQTTVPTTPPTSRPTTPTSAPGFPEPTPPVLPTFP